MNSANAPAKLPLPFANSGSKNTIPEISQIGITPGAASLPDGFPPLNLMPVSSGGVPPSGLDMNGILFESTALNRWYALGAGFPFDGAFSGDANILGYPKGARVMRTDGAGYWLNVADNNNNDPEGSTPTGWVPDTTYGIAAVTMTNANVTLTPPQYGKPIIETTGTLTANLNLIFPNIAGSWIAVNACSGAYTVTFKTAAGSGVTIATGESVYIYGDGANIYSPTAVTVNGGAIPTSKSLVGTNSSGQIVDASSLGAGRLINIRSFTTPGTSTYTPTPGCNSVIVEVQGGGGGGGGTGATASGYFATSGGGGSGAYGRGRFTSGFSGVTVTIGAGGISNAGGAGNNGGTTSFGALLSCPGGYGSLYGPAELLSAPSWLVGGGSGGGVPSGANIFGTPGNIGNFGIILSNALLSGAGAYSLLGSGGAFTGNALPPNNGGGYGSGGSGVCIEGASAALTGGNGAPGVVIVYEYT